MREPLTDPSNRRTFFRVEYPVHDHPVFTAPGLRGEVRDCSETGVRVRLIDTPTDVRLLAGERLSATIRFADGESTDVAGFVLRHDGTTLALRLDAALISFRRILREQWRLRSRYPTRDP